MNGTAIAWGAVVVIVLVLVYLARRANRLDCASGACMDSEAPVVAPKATPVVPVKKAQKSSKKAK